MYCAGLLPATERSPQPVAGRYSYSSGLLSKPSLRWESKIRRVFRAFLSQVAASLGHSDHLAAEKCPLESRRVDRARGPQVPLPAETHCLPLVQVDLVREEASLQRRQSAFCRSLLTPFSKGRSEIYETVATPASIFIGSQSQVLVGNEGVDADLLAVFRYADHGY